MQSCKHSDKDKYLRSISIFGLICHFSDPSQIARYCLMLPCHVAPRCTCAILNLVGGVFTYTHRSRTSYKKYTQDQFSPIIHSCLFTSYCTSQKKRMFARFIYIYIFTYKHRSRTTYNKYTQHQFSPHHIFPFLLTSYCTITNNPFLFLHVFRITSHHSPPCSTPVSSARGISRPGGQAGHPGTDSRQRPNHK